ncbi:MAG: hypothetical protein HYV95_13860 [Opitutae bacterium]|nr:hypothetical protein [Opitutae bacterium]
MKTHLCRFLFASIVLWLLPLQVQAIPDWMPGKNLVISRRINSWNSDNKSKVTIDLQRSGIFKAKLAGESEESALLALTGKITNHSDDTVSSIVVDYIVSNKKTNTEVVRLRLALAVDVYKTATIQFKNAFKTRSYAWENGQVVGVPYTSNKDKAVVLETVKAAVEQLGDDYQWSYEFVAAMPQAIVSAKGDDAYRAMNVDQVLVEVVP